jgi:hypothetical protein
VTIGQGTQQACGELRRHGKKLVLELANHSFHAVIEDIEVRLIGELEKIRNSRNQN